MPLSILYCNIPVPPVAVIVIEPFVLPLHETFNAVALFILGTETVNNLPSPPDKPPGIENVVLFEAYEVVTDVNIVLPVYPITEGAT